MIDIPYSREVQDIYKGGISPNDFDKIFQSGRTPINLYPSSKKGACHQYALFIIIEGHLRGNNANHLSFAKGLDALIGHMKKCGRITFEVDLITNVWKPDSWDKRAYDLNKILRNEEKNIRFHLYTNGRFTKINI